LLLAVPLSAADTPADVVNVKSFGAVGDGLADDTLAIQAAINSAGSSREVYIPRGVFMAVNVELLAGTRLRGAGQGQTILKMLPALTSARYLTDRTGHSFVGFTVLYNSYPSGGYNGNAPLSGIVIRDLTVDGNNSAQTLSESAWGVYLNAVKYARVEAVTVQNCLNHGITAKESAFGIFSNLELLNNGHTTSGAGGDGLVLLGACYDNLVTDSRAIGNVSIGFEDEGRFAGSLGPSWRNKRNRWINLLSKDNGDHNFLSLFTDSSSYANCESVNGGTNGINIVGTTSLVIDGMRVIGTGKYGAWIRPESFGSYGTNVNTRIQGLRVTDPGSYAVRIEGLQGGDIGVWARGVSGGHVVSMSTTPSSNVTLRVDYDGTVPAAYSAGQAYLLGAIRSSGTGVYRLDVAYTGSGLSVSAPTGKAISADNGGMWSYQWSAKRAANGVYAYNPKGLTLAELRLAGCSDHNIWIDGSPGGVSGLLVTNARSVNSGARTLNVEPGVLTGADSRVDASDLSGGAVALDFSGSAGQLFLTNATGWRSDTGCGTHSFPWTAGLSGDP
jgi:hypothetical protein